MCSSLQLNFSEYCQYLNMKFKNVFPDGFSAVIFFLYMALFINQGLIVTASQQSDKSYSYSTIVVILLSEFTKLILTFFLYLRSESLINIIKTLKANSKLCVFYLVPAFLYCLYNNLAFLNLGQYDPTTYFILLQLRVMVTGILFQFLFKKDLTHKQWFSLFILTIGCVVKILGNADKTKQTYNPNQNSFTNVLNNIFSTGTLLILLQVFCSCFAGVYNEKLLKHIGSGVETLAQNMFMCFDSIFFNIIVLFCVEDMTKVFSMESYRQIANINVVMIILNNAAVGIVTAFFLKKLNSILKNYASALELIFTAILSWILFGIEIGIWTILSIFLVIYSTFLYMQNPVVNVAKGTIDDEKSVNSFSSNSQLILIMEKENIDHNDSVQGFKDWPEIHR